MAQPSYQEVERNEHHGVPHSFLGSDDRANLTSLPINEHNAFHEMAGHRPPALFIRKLLLSSINWHDEAGHMIPAGLYDDLLKRLTPADWRSSYVQESIRPVSTVNTGNGQMKAAIHIHLHLWEEQKLVAEGIRALGISEYLSKDVRSFVEGAMMFFRTDNPINALHTYLTDTNHKDERKWTKPLNKTVYKDVKNLIESVQLEHLQVDTRKKLLRILHDHHALLEKRAKQWQPMLGSSIDAIAEYGQSHMDDMIQKRRRKK